MKCAGERKAERHHARCTDAVSSSGLYLPLGERRQDVRVHVRLVDDRLASDWSLVSDSASRRPRLHGLRTHTHDIRLLPFGCPSLTHRTVALLRLQEVLVHLIEFVEDARHHGKTCSPLAFHHYACTHARARSC